LAGGRDSASIDEVIRARLPVVGIAALLLAGVGAIAVARAGTAAPTQLWYHFVVVAEFKVTHTRSTESGPGEPREENVSETTAEWFAESNSATVLTRDGRDKTAARRVRYGQTFAITVTRHPRAAPQNNGGEWEIHDQSFRARITFYRCKGTTACDNKDVPDSAYER
jgi:hypothetical protein